jgi:hypothetical protein
MNRKQEIAAWVFGLLVALALLVTDNGIWALVVLAGLTMLSLRDRQKKKRQIITQAVTPESNEPVQTTPEAILKEVTPHSLAVGMLQLVRESGDMWRTPDIEIPQEADAAVAIACEFHELRIFLDLLKQRFGSGISKLVEASFASILDNVGGRLAIFSRVNAAIVRARRLGPVTHDKTRELESPENADLRLDLQVADQILSFFGESDEQRQAVRFPLAQSLSRARISAQHLFPEFVARVDFDPLSVVMVTRETAYKGTTNRWSETPGCFERHLQRKEGNVLFPISERQPTDEAIREARAKDEADLERLQKDLTAALRFTERFAGQQTIPNGVLLDFLQKELDPLMRRTAEIGDPARRFFKAFEEFRNARLDGLAARHAGRDDDFTSNMESLKDIFSPARFNWFLPQYLRADTPITAEELVSALLCERTNTVAAVGEFYQRHDPKLVQRLYELSVGFLNDATQQGFEVPGADEKLSLLKACALETKSTATVEGPHG